MADPNDPNELLTTDEIAAALKVDPRTVRDYIDSGELPAVKLRREYRVYRRDLEKFLNDRYKPKKDD